MFTKTKLCLSLGLLAATSGWTFAEPPRQPQPAARSTNQQKADEVAAALKSAGVKGKGISVAYDNGTVTLQGQVSDPTLRDRAQRAVEKIAGVRAVRNQLQFPTATAQRTAQPSAVRQVNFQSDELPPTPAQGEETPYGAVVPTQMQSAPVQLTEAPRQNGANNQEVAEQIAAALSQAQLAGYDIEIQYQNGVCALNGSVRTPEQREAASRVVSNVPGVNSVQNNLRFAGPVGQMPQGPAQGQYNPYRNVGYQGQAGAPAAPNGTAAMPAPGAMQGAGAMPGPGAYAAAGQQPGAGYAPGVYSQPNLPSHSWPSYAQYPNYAGVTYPSQYSASAFPYIGPFYPYPQVPAEWRDATLRWDDGQWNLQFRQRTDRWWWFMSPKNW